MRSAVRGAWVVGYDDRGHVLHRGGVVVVDGDSVTFVGPAFEGPVDQVIDKSDCIVAPGFVDTHVHGGLRSGHRLLQDSGRQEYFGQPRWHFTIAKNGTRVPPEPPALAARYTAIELLRNGTTTFVEAGLVGSTDPMASVAEYERSGLRSYLGLMFEDTFLHGDENGRVVREFDEARGQKLQASAREFIEAVDGTAQGRLRGLVVPRESDTCSPALLRASRAMADEYGLPLTCHVGYHPDEFFHVVRTYGCTPVELLRSTGVLGPSVLLGHCNFPAESKLTNYADGHDLLHIAESGATVAHCPVNLVRRGRKLDNWDVYRKAGVAMALGTDTWPRDMILQMRVASYLGKALSGSYLAASAASVYEAATLGGAAALGRPDLGRLRPGAKADIIAIKPSGLRWGAVRDPIKSLVDCGCGDDVDMVMVDGRMLMNGRADTDSEAEQLRLDAQVASEAAWDQVQSWDPLGRTAEEVSPWSFPLA